MILNFTKKAEYPEVHPEGMRSIEILQHAIKYLEPLGAGRDHEFDRARCILQYALDEVKRELFNREVVNGKYSNHSGR